MPTGYIAPKDFERKFSVTASKNSQATEVTENLSGNAQLLKSADNSVTYKNFNQSDIEETVLVQNAYNRAFQADQTDEYAQDVTTSQLEVAPQIDKRVILTESFNTTIKNLDETVSTQDHRESLNMDQSVYIKKRRLLFHIIFNKNLKHSEGWLLSIYKERLKLKTSKAKPMSHSLAS